ncbi:MAG: histidine phosphatase family protein [Methyloligellaceae bacterium]
MQIHFIRHGQSIFNEIFNRDGIDPGITDAPLTQIGKQQAQEAKQKLDQIDVEMVITSPLSRAIETTQIIFPEHRLIRIDPRIREVLNHSCDIGRGPEVLRNEFPALDFGNLSKIWWYDGRIDHRGIPVEPNESLISRAEDFVTEIKILRLKNLAIVSHGNFINHIINRQLQNCEIAVFSFFQ